MSDVTPISVAAPKLAGSTVGTATRIDRPVELTLAQVKLPDGSVLASDASAGAFLYRVADQGEQVWNDQARAWQASPAEDDLGMTLAPLALGYFPTGDHAWSATLNASPQLDASGAARYDIAPKENPKYFARALVSATRGTTRYRGLSGPSPMLSFARVATLALPAPQLTWQGGAQAPIEKPVTITLPDLVLPSGATVTADDAIKVGVFVYRASGELWNEKSQQWESPPADVEALAALTPLALTYKPASPAVWQGTLAGSGLVDKAGAPRFVAINEGGAPYRIRAFAHLKKDGVVYPGLGPESMPLAFVKTTGEERFKIEFDTDGAQDATQATIRLRDAAGALAGYLRIDANSRAIELATCDGGGGVRAAIRLTADGDIELAPASGRRVIALADVETGRIRYQPSGGGAKRDLA